MLGQNRVLTLLEGDIEASTPLGVGASSAHVLRRAETR